MVRKGLKTCKNKQQRSEWPLRMKSSVVAFKLLRREARLCKLAAHHLGLVLLLTLTQMCLRFEDICHFQDLYAGNGMFFGYGPFTPTKEVPVMLHLH